MKNKSDMDSTHYSSTITAQDFRAVDSTPDDDVTGGGEDKVDQKRSHSVREAMEQRMQPRIKTAMPTRRLSS
jgi:hypothetical protein